MPLSPFFGRCLRLYLCLYLCLLRLRKATRTEGPREPSLASSGNSRLRGQTDHGGKIGERTRASRRPLRSRRAHPRTSQSRSRAACVSRDPSAGRHLRSGRTWRNLLECRASRRQTGSHPRTPCGPRHRQLACLQALVPPSSPETTQPRTHTRRENLPWSPEEKEFSSRRPTQRVPATETRPAEAVPQPDGGPGHQALLQ